MIGTILISNSVTAAPEILQMARDGRTAFVTERLGERPERGDTVQDLPPGKRLFAVDLSDSAVPRVVDTAEIASFPEALSVARDGRRVAVVSNTPQASFIQIAPYSEGLFGMVARFDLAELGITGSAPTARGGVTATNVHWHPSGRFLAVNINTQNRVAFFEIRDVGGAVSLRSWSSIVEVGVDPFIGRFSPDGRYYFTSNWGRYFAANNLEKSRCSFRLTRILSSTSIVVGAISVTGRRSTNSMR